MKLSLRAKRKYHRAKRVRPLAELNLVSLVDMFTILLCFLLVNAPDGEVLENEYQLNLPESVSEINPNGGIILTLTPTDIKLGALSIMPVSSALADGQVILPPLQKALAAEAQKHPYSSPEAQQKGQAITIMGDSSVSYALLKKIMATCAQSEYRRIALAINQIDGKPSAPVGG